jgi:membrane protease YdiL (CAAX protease family)
MNNPEHTPHLPEENPVHEDAGTTEAALSLPKDLASQTWDSSALTSAPVDLFQAFSKPEAVLPARIPHLGHLFLLAALAAVGFVCATLLMMAAVRIHLFGAANMTAAASNVHYILGSETIIYLVILAGSLLIFPLFWNRSFFAGIHWRGATALHLGWRLPAIALGCFALAALDETLLPGPAHAPIENIFRSPGAAWLMFGFGVTFAPFFEEIIFRGFLLPSLATAWDWAIERSTGKHRLPLDENGHPQWSNFAMVFASIATSLPFAMVHADQQGHSIGPFILLITISLILCVVRLKTRSLAASTMVHAGYNFLLFFLMLVSTGGFRHLDKM